jgi:EmrB/QacA subfamily drug resistance transporter
MTDGGARRTAWVLIVGALAPLLDTTVVNVAVDRLGREMGASVSAVQWVVTGYLLALSMAVPLSGWAAQRWGARAVWVASLALFVAASVAAGLAWDIGSLIAFRVLQGVAGGLMQPIVTTLLVAAAGGRGLGRLMATVTLPAVVVPVLGPAAGGLIVGALGWRWVFLVNVPLCLTAIALAVRYLPITPPAARRPRLDVLGLALLSPGLAALVYGLSEAGGRGGFAGPAVLGPLGGGAVLVAAYCLHSLRARHEPLVDVRTLRVRSFAAATGLLWFSGLAVYGAMLLLPLYYQRERGFDALAAGMLLAPQGIGSLLPRTFAGRLADRIGARPVVLAGVVLTALGTFAFTQAGPETRRGAARREPPGARRRHGRRHRSGPGRRVRRVAAGAATPRQRDRSHRPAARRVLRHRGARRDPLLDGQLRRGVLVGTRLHRGRRVARSPAPGTGQASHSSRSPRMTKSGRRGGSAASRMAGSLRRSASSVAATSTRASGAPRQ